MELPPSSGNDALVMEAERASETSDYSSILTRLVAREHFIAYQKRISVISTSFRFTKMFNIIKKDKMGRTCNAHR
jgi:hypothetical protein